MIDEIIEQTYYNITQDKKSKMYTHEIEYIADRYHCESCHVLQSKKLIVRIYRFYMMEVFSKAIIDLETRLKIKVTTNGAKLMIKFKSKSNKKYEISDIII